jgi:hypothetical protein
MWTSTVSVDRKAFNGYDYCRYFSLIRSVYGAALPFISSSIDARSERDLAHVG